ncbi:MAG: hypothetical protein HY657_06600 [Acidobacteria bacterium]|nr:hypothetical protein [Acidobacteriota bacterium]
MRTAGAMLLVALLGAVASVEAQRGRGAQPAMRTEPATFDCPSPLGEGVQTKRVFCDVMTGRDPAEGIIVALPPHTGPVTLSFDLHNRHIYSEELIAANRAYRHYTATIGVLTPNNDLLSRFVVQNEFRTAADLIDRIAGEGSPGGLKAVAPTGLESLSLMIPADVDSVSILGEKLSIIRPDAAAPDNFITPGRPIAIISNVVLQYRPGPARRGR